MKLSNDQVAAASDILGFLKGYGSTHILSGYAGTGKTFLLRHLLKQIPGWRVVLCAPTNKAVRVLQTLGTGVDTCTIYSLLGLRMQQEEDRLVLTKAEGSKDGRYGLVVLDEAGMANTELHRYMLASMNKHRGIKYLMLGDEAQLNPVGEAFSPIWGSAPTSYMTQVMRHDNAILDLATHIRGLEDLADLVLTTNNTRREGVWALNHELFLKRVRKHARREMFIEGESKAIAWRNKSVDALNRVIRAEQFGPDAELMKWVPNERVVFTSPMELQSGFKIFTDDEGLVLNSAVSKHHEYDFDVEHLTMKVYGDKVTVPVVHPKHERRVGDMLADMAHKARTEDKSMWKKFWGLKESLGWIRHGYAFTTHRAQGSTYPNIHLDVADILSNSNRDEAKRCLYTGASRPSHKLFLNAD